MTNFIFYYPQNNENETAGACGTLRGKEEGLQRIWWGNLKTWVQMGR